MKRTLTRAHVADVLVDLPGGLYLLATTLVVIASIVLVLVATIATGSWLGLLVLVLPAYWLLMWSTS